MLTKITTRPFRSSIRIGTNEAYKRQRADLYCGLDRRLPGVATSVYESVLVRLQIRGISGRNIAEMPALSEGRLVDQLSPTIRLSTELIIEEGSAFIEVVIDHYDRRDQLVLRERVEAFEDAPFTPFRPNHLCYFTGVKLPDETLWIEHFLDGDGPADGEAMREWLDEPETIRSVGLPGDHHAIRWLTQEGSRGLPSRGCERSL
jgi:hypothetical protein